jgi:serine phosphatase RsbU (regulator of sigma subunit)
MTDEPIMDYLGVSPADDDGYRVAGDGADAPGDWTLSCWRVRPGQAAQACADLAGALARLGASAEDRGRAVASLWTALRGRVPTTVTFRLTGAEDHRIGLVAVQDDVIATMRLPATQPGAAGAVGPEGPVGPVGSVGPIGPVGPLGPEGPVTDTAGTGSLPALLDIIADTRDALDQHRRELENTDRGLLALHAELAGQAEQLRWAGERQRELLRTEQAARASAEAARARLAFLSHVGAVLGASLDHRQVLSRLATLLVPRYAGQAQVWLVAEHGDLELQGVAADGHLPSPPTPPSPPEVVRRVRVTRRPEQVSGAGPDGGETSLLVVPLVSLGTVLGVLTVTPPGRPFGHDDVIIVSEAAGRAAAALANALRFEQEREVAQRLQHAMLTELPTGPGVECAARYLPAVTGLNVGGDWYDAFCRPDGTLVLAVGDVAGHGLLAATLMGQLRTALRAYAMDLPEPGEVLARMHALIRHIDPDHCATAVLAMVTPGGRMSLAVAGHPPPLLRQPDGSVRQLECSGPMLGLPIDHAYTAVTLALSPGSVLLFYTDGLIERRDTAIDAGIDQLAAAFGRAPGRPDQIADTVCEVMLSDSSREDDTCLLVCQLTADRDGVTDWPAGAVQAEPAP